MSATKDFLFADDLAPDPPTVAYRVTTRPAMLSAPHETLICRDCKEHPDFAKWYDPDDRPEPLTRAEVVRFHTERERPMDPSEIATCDSCQEELR